jgi:hypothetical protein
MGAVPPKMEELRELCRFADRLIDLQGADFLHFPMPTGLPGKLV